MALSRPARTGQEIAQIGAAIGREFSYRLLEAVSPDPGGGVLRRASSPNSWRRS